MTTVARNSDILPEAALWIGDERAATGSGGAFASIDPTTGRQFSIVPLAGRSEVDRAVKAARRALPGWRGLAGSARRDVLLAIADRLIADGERLAAIGAMDAGIPIALGVPLSSQVPASWFRYYAGWADKLAGAVPVPDDPMTLMYTRRVPFGVVALVTAFNAPMAFVGMKVAAALAAGNTVVLKPSELAPWTILRFAEICRELGLPAGVVNVIPGSKEAGEALVGHPDVDRISFTGGGVTARAILTTAAQTLTPVSLELGGKSAAIIFDDADLDQAAGLTIQGSIALLTGQACIAGTRILVQRSVYAEVIDRLAAVIGALPQGDPADAGTILGPVINEFQCNRILGVIEAAGRDGDTRLICGGQRVGGALADGFFVAPTLLADVDPDSKLAQEEVFGPVVAVTPFDDEAEAIAIANNSTYGLAGYIFTSHIGRGHRVAHAIEAGLVTVNSAYQVSPALPFGGFKASGFGREGGLDGVMEMTHSQSIQISIV